MKKNIGNGTTFTGTDKQNIHGYKQIGRFYFLKPVSFLPETI